MSVWVKDQSSVPAEGWIYLVGATGYQVRVSSYNQLYEAVVNHCNINNITPPTPDEVIEWVCTNLTVDCRDGKEPFANRFSMGLPPAPGPSCCGGAK